MLLFLFFFFPLSFVFLLFLFLQECYLYYEVISILTASVKLIFLVWKFQACIRCPLLPFFTEEIWKDEGLQTMRRWIVFFARQLLSAGALGKLMTSVPWDKDRFKPHALRYLGTLMKWKPNGNNPRHLRDTDAHGSPSKSSAHPDSFSLFVVFFTWILKKNMKAAFHNLVRWCCQRKTWGNRLWQTVFVDIELGFGAFGHCFHIVSQVRKGIAVRSSSFCLSYDSSLFKERNERTQGTGISCFKCAFFSLTWLFKVE